jgi:DNA-binding response OmpR family regulator
MPWPITQGMSCRVLVVEDDADLREMMAQILTLEGFEADTATDGADALNHLKAAGPPPHVILLDLMMPRMDGWAFVDRQAATPAIAGIPVVVVSAAPRDRLRGIRAAAILQKPLNFDELITTVRTHC